MSASGSSISSISDSGSGGTWPAAVTPAALAVQRLVGQPVGVRVLLARDPGVRRAGRRQPARLHRQRPHVGVLDLPAARHLLDDELGVHPDLDLGPGCELLGELAARRSARSTRRRCWSRPRSWCRPRRGPRRSSASLSTAPYAAGPGLPRDPPSASMTTERQPSQTGLGVRTRIRWHSSQRMTSSAGALRMTASSALSMVSWQPPHSRARSGAAPTPPFCSRSRS